MSNMFTATRRAWLYRVGTSIVALAALYGLIGEDEVTGWTSLIAALFMGTLATANTDT